MTERPIKKKEHREEVLNRKPEPIIRPVVKGVKIGPETKRFVEQIQQQNPRRVLKGPGSTGKTYRPK
jgi:hypothetical protein